MQQTFFCIVEEIGISVGIRLSGLRPNHDRNTAKQAALWMTFHVFLERGKDKAVEAETVRLGIAPVSLLLPFREF